MDFDKLYDKVQERYDRAKESVSKIEKALFEHSAISDTIPGYHAEVLEFESYDKDNFTVLFVDMRGSTKRARRIGPQKTFLSMHAYIPALLEVINYYNGKVIDIMGDGVMVFFGGKNSGVAKSIAAQNAGLCGLDMVEAVKRVVNPILRSDGIDDEISIGVGIAHGDVIVTKIGIDEFFDVKAFGDCVNTASKYSNRDNNSNRVCVTKKVKDLWPSSEGGKLQFLPFTMGQTDGYWIQRG